MRTSTPRCVISTIGSLIGLSVFHKSDGPLNILVDTHGPPSLLREDGLFLSLRRVSVLLNSTQNSLLIPKRSSLVPFP